ncbi:MAG: hypothetical protein PHI97_08920 [Desulfobulbus sp.]|nr:hypothetical protein [Desulfobulbus sp.]
METTEKSYPVTHKEREEWLNERISLCRDATRDIQRIHEWASRESVKIQNLSPQDPRILMNS